MPGFVWIWLLSTLNDPVLLRIPPRPRSGCHFCELNNNIVKVELLSRQNMELSQTHAEIKKEKEAITPIAAPGICE